MCMSLGIYNYEAIYEESMRAVWVVYGSFWEVPSAVCLLYLWFVTPLLVEHVDSSCLALYQSAESSKLKKVFSRLPFHKGCYASCVGEIFDNFLIYRKWWLIIHYFHHIMDQALITRWWTNDLEIGYESNRMARNQFDVEF